MKASIITLVLAAIISGGVALALTHQAAPTQKVGSNGPIGTANYFCNAGVCEYFGSTGLRTATTTPCAIQSPAATSTVTGSIRFDTGSTTATTWTIGVSASGFATTTTLGNNYVLPANAQGFDLSSTTGGNNIVGPNQWIVFSETGGITAGDSAGTGFAPAGRCRVSFITTDQ